MGYSRGLRVASLLSWVLALVLLVETRLGQPILPWGGPDPTTGAASGFLLLLGVLLWLAADVAGLRHRVAALERRLRDDE